MTTKRVVAAVLAFLCATTAVAQDAGEHRLVVGGVSLRYRVAGTATGEPVVFLHGGPGEGSNAFATFAGPALERSLRMVYLDQRGSGRSDRPKDASAYSIPILVDDLEHLRTALGVPRIALVGHSFGTVLALEYAAAHPDRVSRVVVAGAVPDMPALENTLCRRLAQRDRAAYLRAVKARPADAQARCDPFSAYDGEAQGAFVMRNMFPDPAIARKVETADAVDGANTGELAGAIFAQGFMNYRFTRVADLRAPVLVIAGERDLQAVVGPQRALAQALPDGRLRIYQGRGHFMFVEDPERFARDVTGFLHGP